MLISLGPDCSCALLDVFIVLSVGPEFGCCLSCLCYWYGGS